MRKTATGPPVDRGPSSSSNCRGRSAKQGRPKGLHMRTVPIIVLLCGASVAGIAQTPVALDVSDKLRYHAEGTFSPASLGLSGLKAGYSQMTDNPREWGQGASGYGKRVGSSIASSGVRNALAFGLDSTLHQDPRYFRSVSTRFWPRVGHALRGTIITRTDSGGETLAIWRLGSAYGAAFIVNQWYPDRFHTVGHGLADGSYRLGFDVLKNIAAEFWPDMKRKLLRRKS